jgi:hypothetical protein
MHTQPPRTWRCSATPGSQPAKRTLYPPLRKRRLWDGRSSTARQAVQLPPSLVVLQGTRQPGRPHHAVIHQNVEIRPDILLPLRLPISPGNAESILKQNCHLDRRNHGPAAHHCDEKRLGSATTLRNGCPFLCHPEQPTRCGESGEK